MQFFSSKLLFHFNGFIQVFLFVELDPIWSFFKIVLWQHQLFFLFVNYIIIIIVDWLMGLFAWSSLYNYNNKSLMMEKWNNNNNFSSFCFFLNYVVVNFFLIQFFFDLKHWFFTLFVLLLHHRSIILFQNMQKKIMEKITILIHY
jgi:hypothetical protein